MQRQSVRNIELVAFLLSVLGIIGTVYHIWTNFVVSDLGWDVVWLLGFLAGAFVFFRLYTRL